MPQLQSENVELSIDPWRGGGVLSFKWRGFDVFRPAMGGGGPLDLASFAMVPFCNRIAGGEIEYGAQTRKIPTALSSAEAEHALHGVGWISPWVTRRSNGQSVHLGLSHDGILWPWEFEAEQSFQVEENGYLQQLAITNCDALPMPVGLGFHPYFPVENAALELQADGYWATGEDRLPDRHNELQKSPDWFAGDGFDNCFTGCRAPIAIEWPTHRLTIQPSSNLPFVHVYSPPGEAYFCVEPVSHIPDAVNSKLDSKSTGIVMLPPGERMLAECRFTVEARL